MARRILTPVAILLVVATAASFLLPGDYEVSRTLRIGAPPARIQASLVELGTWPDWSAWSRTFDPECQWSPAGPPTGLDSSLTWRGPRLGQGELRLTKVEPLRGVRYAVTFAGGKRTGTGIVSLRDAGGATEVTWTARGSLGVGPLARLQMLLLDSRLGPDLERSLAGLKTRVEAAAAPNPDD